MSKFVEEQAMPTPNDGDSMWDKVIEDMKDRDKVGRKRYGTPLQAFNGRDSLIDAYQESQDLTVYIRQTIEEMKWIRLHLLAGFQNKLWKTLN